MESSIDFEFLTHTDLPKFSRGEFYRQYCLGYVDIYVEKKNIACTFPSC